MANWLTFGLQIEIVAIGLFLYGLFTFLKAIRDVSDKIKLAIILVLLSLVMEIIQGIMSRMLILRSIPSESILWLVSPFVGFVGAYFLIVGAKKFLSEIETY
jgi:hypothetical protein